MTSLSQRAETGLDALTLAVRDSDLDALVCLSPQAVTYAIGIQIPSQSLMRWRHAAAVITADGLAGVLSVDMEETTVAAALPDVRMVVWREFVDDPMVSLAQLLADAGIGGRVGIETDFIPTREMSTLSEHSRGIEWVAGQELITRSRVRKTPAEIRAIRRLAAASDTALYDALQATRAGDTEHEIGARIIGSLYQQGISDHRVLIVATGDRSHFPNVGPSDRVVNPGEVIRVEVFAADGGYQSGVARTAVLGEPSREVADAWEHLSSARTQGLAALAPGADPRAVYAAYVDALGPLRDRAISFFGHGMGLDVHEEPYVSATATYPIEAGAILGMEPFAMLPPKFGLQVKDIVLVTDPAENNGAGYQVLSDRLDGGTLHVVGD